MLRITVENHSKTATLKLEGKLAGPWIDELARTWASVTANTSGEHILLDICDVTFIAPEGKAQLRKMSGLGAQFKTGGCLSRSIVEEITKSKPADDGH